MIDIKYPYRCRAHGIQGWIPLEKPVNKDYRIQICMSRVAKARYHGVRFPGFSQPSEITNFGQIFHIEKNPNYVKPHPNWVAVVVNNKVCYVPRFESKITSKQKRTQAKAVSIWDRAKTIRAKQLKEKPSPSAQFVDSWTKIIKAKKVAKKASRHVDVVELKTAVNGKRQTVLMTVPKPL